MNEITKLASLNKTAAILVDEFSKRERFRSRSDLRKMFKALEDKHKGVNKDDFMAVFHRLQEMGLGSIVIGRGTNPTRFVWNYNLKDIGLAAKGKIKSSDIQSLAPGGAPYQGKPVSPSPEVAQRAHVPHRPSQTATDDIDVLIITPKSGDVKRFKVTADRAELVARLLSEFGSPA